MLALKRSKLTTNPSVTPINSCYFLDSLWPIIASFLGLTSWQLFELSYVCQKWNRYSFLHLITNFRVITLEQLPLFVSMCTQHQIRHRVLKLDIRLHWDRFDRRHFRAMFQLMESHFPMLQRLSLLSADMNDLSNVHKQRSHLHYAINTSTRVPNQFPVLPNCNEIVTDLDLLPLFNFENMQKLPNFNSLIVRTTLASGKLQYVQYAQKIQEYWKQTCARTVHVTLWHEGCCFRGIQQSNIPKWSKKADAICVVSKHLSAESDICGISSKRAYSTFLSDFIDVQQKDLERSMIFTFVKTRCLIAKDASVLYDVFVDALTQFRCKEWNYDTCSGNSTQVCVDMLMEYFSCVLSPHKHYIYGISLV